MELLRSLLNCSKRPKEDSLPARGIDFIEWQHMEEYDPKQTTFTFPRVKYFEKRFEITPGEQQLLYVEQYLVRRAGDNKMLTIQPQSHSTCLSSQQRPVPTVPLYGSWIKESFPGCDNE